MRMYRGKVLHKEKWRDQEQNLGEHPRGRQEKEMSMAKGGKWTERRTRRGRYISSFS